MMIRTLAGAGLALLGLACASGGVTRRAEPVPFEVRGVVVDARTRAPAAGVLVRLAAADPGARTDRAGAFQIRGHAPPGRYVLTASMLGYAPMQRPIRIRHAGTVDLGTMRIRPVAIHLDDLIVPDCMRWQRPPADTAPGASVRMQTDSTGTFWMVCSPVHN
jgi:hypothetical protein